ncbi:MAG: peroxide stress protein YaaA [Actinobacteria bacterium]|uniref:Unannotated protein n=1 Tax=freshwater metagenome TaxID=449393 RepID=A0A6J5YPK9_9ZZZZ|nr:peroxide stress protein YaaA [Actinomycetota bacterium]
MLLLPPSESKAEGTQAKPLKLSTLAHPQLNELREHVIGAVEKLAKGPRAKAREVLGLSAKQESEIERDANLATAKTSPAWQIYSGVLFDALDAQSLSATARKKFEETTFVSSALFGLISVADHIPAYRLSGDTRLPRLESLARVWSDSVSSILERQQELIVDLRSGTYVALGPLPDDVAAVVPKIWQKMPSGPPKIVTHHNKATKGRIVRELVATRKRLDTAEVVAEVIASLGADVDISYAKSHPIINVVIDVA